MQNLLSLPVSTLEWAANKANSSLYDIASDLFKKNLERILKGQMTLAQVKQFSKRTKTPFGFLFLKTPPPEYKPQIPDLRVAKLHEPLSKDFYDLYKDIEYKQSWYADYLMSIEANKLSFVGKYKNKNISSDIIAKDIMKTLGVTSQDQRNAKNTETYYKLLTEKMEQVGILVFRNSIVINNTRRCLSREEFQGFVITNDYAPIIFINAADQVTANVFTLAHELAHIWIGSSGILDAKPNLKISTEVKCNEIAANILIPKNEFLSDWEKMGHNKNIQNKLIALKKIFKVSELVIARVALTYNKITQDYYKDLQDVAIKKHKEKKNTGAPPPYVTYPIKNSKSFMELVLSLATNGKMDFKDAGVLLNIAPNKVMNYVK